MLAHTQYCSSGDHTVDAITQSIKRVVQREGDEYFVFVVSDANLDRYGIEPKVIGRELIADGRVNANVIFIASFANEADRILQNIPRGKGHVCLNTSYLPKLFKQIFTSSFDLMK
jgi:hypothetical protein